MSSTILLPPRAQLCIRYCSNKQQQPRPTSRRRPRPRPHDTLLVTSQRVGGETEGERDGGRGRRRKVSLTKTNAINEVTLGATAPREGGGGGLKEGRRGGKGERREWRKGAGKGKGARRERKREQERQKHEEVKKGREERKEREKMGGVFSEF